MFRLTTDSHRCCHTINLWQCRTDQPNELTKGGKRTEYANAPPAKRAKKGARRMSSNSQAGPTGLMLHRPGASKVNHYGCERTRCMVQGPRSAHSHERDHWRWEVRQRTPVAAAAELHAGTDVTQGKDSTVALVRTSSVFLVIESHKFRIQLRF